MQLSEPLETAVTNLARLAAAIVPLSVLSACADFPGFTQRRVQPLAGGPMAGRAPWQAAWQCDSGGDNDRRPDLPYFQQGGGQQTGGPARNLLPSDNLHFVPR
jgi:hypothetical protein